MKLLAKNKEKRITVNSKGNRIITTKGFVVLTKGTVNGSDRVSKHVLQALFDIPDEVIIED